jgi:hypothetical protein
MKLSLLFVADDSLSTVLPGSPSSPSKTPLTNGLDRASFVVEFLPKEYNKTEYTFCFGGSLGTNHQGLATMAMHMSQVGPAVVQKNVQGIFLMGPLTGAQVLRSPRDQAIQNLRNAFYTKDMKLDHEQAQNAPVFLSLGVGDHRGGFLSAMMWIKNFYKNSGDFSHTKLTQNSSACLPKFNIPNRYYIVRVPTLYTLFVIDPATFLFDEEQQNWLKNQYDALVKRNSSVDTKKCVGEMEWIGLVGHTFMPEENFSMFGSQAYTEDKITQLFKNGKLNKLEFTPRAQGYLQNKNNGSLSSFLSLYFFEDALRFHFYLGTQNHTYGVCIETPVVQKATPLRQSPSTNDLPAFNEALPFRDAPHLGLWDAKYKGPTTEISVPQASVLVVAGAEGSGSPLKTQTPIAESHVWDSSRGSHAVAFSEAKSFFGSFTITLSVSAQTAPKTTKITFKAYDAQTGEADDRFTVSLERSI